MPPRKRAHWLQDPSRAAGKLWGWALKRRGEAVPDQQNQGELGLDQEKD